MNAKALLVCLICVITAPWAGISMAQDPGIMGPPNPLMTQRIRTERQAHVGELLPAHLLVAHGSKSEVSLRSLLHGPVIVIKITPDCPPCVQLLDAVRDSTGGPARAPKPELAVLYVGESERLPKGLPAEVLLVSMDWHAAQDGFFAGTITPTTFYFDADLRLVARRPGLSTVAESLRFPSLQ